MPHDIEKNENYVFGKKNFQIFFAICDLVLIKFRKFIIISPDLRTHEGGQIHFWEISGRFLGSSWKFILINHNGKGSGTYAEEEL